MSNETYEEYFIQAWEYLEKGENQKAVDFFKNILKNDPGDLDALKTLTVVYYLTGNDDVNECCDKFLKLKRDDDVVLSIKGAYLIISDEEDLSKDYLEAALNLDKENLLALEFMGRYYTLKEDWNNALKYIDCTLDLLEEDDPDILALKALALCYLNQYEDSVDCSELVLKLDDKNIFALKAKAHSLFNLKRYEEALVFFKEYIEQDNENINVLVEMGLTFSNLNQHEKALRCFESAFNLDDKNILALELKGRCLYDLKMYDKALNVFNYYLKLKHDDVEILLLKALSLYFIDRDEEALKILNQALKIDPNHLELMHWNAEILRFLKRYDEAMKCAKSLLKIEERNEGAINLIGQIYYMQNLLEESLEYFWKVLEINPYNGFALIYAKRALKRLGEIEKSKELESRLLNDPNVDQIVIEKQLENKLVKDLSILKDHGYDLTLKQQQHICKDEEKKNIFDLLCTDEDGKPVIIELKVVMAGIETFEQISNYLECYKQNSKSKIPVKGLVISYGCNDDFKSLISDREDISYIDIDHLGL